MPLAQLFALCVGASVPAHVLAGPVIHQDGQNIIIRSDANQDNPVPRWLNPQEFPRLDPHGAVLPRPYLRNLEKQKPCPPILDELGRSVVLAYVESFSLRRRALCWTWL